MRIIRIGSVLYFLVGSNNLADNILVLPNEESCNQYCEIDRTE